MIEPLKVFAIDKLGFQNVVSKRKMISYKEMESFYTSFINEILNNGASIKGPYFYSLNNVPKDDMLDIEMFMPIAENHFDCVNLKFQLYFEINNLVKTVIQGNIEANTEIAYASILNALEKNGLNIATPFYHVTPITGSKFVNLYMGYYKEAKE